MPPRPSKATFEATTLVSLLQKISAKFKKAFREVLEGRVAAHPLENVQSLLPPNSWLGLYPVPDHRRDAAWAENALTLLYGNEPIGMQIDWNPTDPECIHMYVHNNIFFSFAIDADLEKLSKKCLDTSSKTLSSTTLQSHSDKTSIPLHGESLVAKGEKMIVQVQKILMLQMFL